MSLDVYSYTKTAWPVRLGPLGQAETRQEALLMTSAVGLSTAGYLERARVFMALRSNDRKQDTVPGSSSFEHYLEQNGVPENLL